MRTVHSLARRGGVAGLPAAMLLVASMAGCSNVTPPDTANFTTVPAKGQVTKGGQPVASGILIFEPVVDGGSDVQATSAIQGGSFALVSGGEKEGAVPGRYRAVLKDDLGVEVPKAEPQEVTISEEGSEGLSVAFP